jgi:hypothetical protein
MESLTYQMSTLSLGGGADPVEANPNTGDSAEADGKPTPSDPSAKEELDTNPAPATSMAQHGSTTNEGSDTSGDDDSSSTESTSHHTEEATARRSTEDWLRSRQFPVPAIWNPRDFKYPSADDILEDIDACLFSLCETKRWHRRNWDGKKHLCICMDYKASR